MRRVDSRGCMQPSALQTVLCVLTLSCLATQVHCAARIQYFSSSGGATLMLDSSVILNYNGEDTDSLNGSDSLANASVVWSTTATDCTFSDASNITSAVKCEVPGKKTITLRKEHLSNQTESFSLHLIDTTECYAWYAVLVQDEELLINIPYVAEAEMEMRIWIVSPELRDNAEGSQTAVTPSTFSAQRTRQYQNLGELPVVHIPSISGVTATTTLEFDHVHAYWKMQLKASLPHSAGVFIEGRGVSSFGCSVSDDVYVIGVEKVNTTVVNVTGTIDPADFVNAPLTSAVLHFSVDPCEPTMIVMPLGETYPLQFFLTQSGGRQGVILQFSLPDDAPAEYSDMILQKIVFTDDSFVVLTNVSVFYALFDDPELTLHHATMPDNATSIDRLAGNTVCDTLLGHNYERTEENDIIIAFSHNDTSSFLVSEDDGATFQWNSIGVTVDDAVSLEIVQRVISTEKWLLLFATSTGHAIAIRGENDGSWRLGTAFTGDQYLADGSTGAEPGIFQSPSGSGEVLLFGDRIFYSADAGETVLEVPLRNRDITLGLSDSEYILQVEGDVLGRYFVLTSERRLFMGSLQVPEAIELQSGERPFSEAGMIMQAAGTSYQLLFIAREATEGLFAARPVPIENELANFKELQGASRTISGVDCPFLSFNSDQAATYYLDMQETVKYTLTVTASADSYISATVASSDPDRLVFDAVVSAVLANDGSGAMQRMRAVVLSERATSFATRAERMRDGQGEVAIRSSPSSINLQCDNAVVVSNVRVGCPPGRHIRIRKAEQCSSQHGKTPHQLGLSEQVYSSELYGCKMSVYHQTTGFRPVVDIYDGDTFVRELEAEYVVHEVTGRSDYTFNASNSNMRCVTKPMSWAEARRSGAAHGKSAMQYWTPETSWSCWDSTRPVVPFSGGSTYDLLNSTGRNAIIFDPAGEDGLFLFKVRVVAPDASYCTLEAHFALEVYGAPLSLVQILTIVSSATGAIIGFLIATYFYYRNQMRLKKSVQD